MPFKNQESANIVQKRLNNLNSKIQTTLWPVFVSRKLNQDLQVREATSLLLSTNNALCITLNVACVMRGMLATPVPTCTSAWMDINKIKGILYLQTLQERTQWLHVARYQGQN